MVLGWVGLVVVLGGFGCCYFLWAHLPGFYAFGVAHASLLSPRKKKFTKKILIMFGAHMNVLIIVKVKILMVIEVPKKQE